MRRIDKPATLFNMTDEELAEFFYEFELRTPLERHLDYLNDYYCYTR